MRKTPPSNAVAVPLGYPTSLIYLDESGSKATASRFFVIGAIKLREPGFFARDLREVRDAHGFSGEFKFSEITRGTLPVYMDVVDRLHESDAHLAACVVNGDIYNPFKGQQAWLAHAEVLSQLLVGCINRRELVSVLLDGISTPKGCSLEDLVRSNVNRRLRATSIVGAACLDSKSSDSLQVADLFAGAVHFERRQSVNPLKIRQSDKARVAERMGALFGCPGFPDGRGGRVNVATYRGRGGRGAQRQPLRVVHHTSRAG